MFRAGLWSINTLGHSADLKTQRCSLGFSEIINLYYFLRHKYLLLVFNSLVMMENPLMGK